VIALDLDREGNPLMTWEPLYSVDDAQKFFFMNFIKYEDIHKIDKMHHIPEDPPEKGKFACASPALLVALLELVLKGS